MSTKLDKLIEEIFSKYKWSEPLTEASNDEILRHCPIPAAPPLPEPPKPAIPEEVARNVDGCYRIRFDKCKNVVIRRIKNNRVLLGSVNPVGFKDSVDVSVYGEANHATSWEYLGDIPLDVAEHGDCWYWRGGEVVEVIGRDYLCCGSNSIRQLTNDGCKWEYIPRRGGE